MTNRMIRPGIQRGYTYPQSSTYCMLDCMLECTGLPQSTVIIMFWVRQCYLGCNRNMIWQNVMNCLPHQDLLSLAINYWWLSTSVTFLRVDICHSFKLQCVHGFLTLQFIFIFFSSRYWPKAKYISVHRAIPRQVLLLKFLIKNAHHWQPREDIFECDKNEWTSLRNPIV